MTQYELVFEIASALSDLVFSAKEADLSSFDYARVMLEQLQSLGLAVVPLESELVERIRSRATVGALQAKPKTEEAIAAEMFIAANNILARK